jgi:hypothetical protein
MNVVWCLEGMTYFGRLLSEALNWPLVIGSSCGTCDTVVIVGLYDAPDYTFTLQCTARAKRRIIYFCGSDVEMLTAPENLPDALFLCEAEWIQRELVTRGVTSEVCQFPTSIHLAPTDFPEKPAVAFYKGNNALKYGEHYVQILQAAMPDVDFWVYGIDQFPPEQMQDLADRTRVYLRLTEHDGAAASAREFMEAGRRAIITADLPYAKVVSRADPIGIIKAVRDGVNESRPDWEAAAWYREMNRRERFLDDFERVTGLDADA